ncbi:DDRGK domain-containing protein 1 [Gracilariopsis chorda]|uniref:DDRGK domain-containing protein 1 n=1 Tax=Gracilariopsis chorda TaxID=448386 RepID=A0A2V3IZA1_9FLOR|nr:DDRGK domain-containing protein 1 [Gracilariopsis chorda]|eukprot:PXF47007.1 DDRGK domain-containing protein 1 [Gracilariopsis chorda]
MGLTIWEVVPFVALFGVLFTLVVLLQKVRNAPAPQVAEGDRAESRDVGETGSGVEERSAGTVRRRRGGLARMRRAVGTEEGGEVEESVVSGAAGRKKSKKEANREARREAREARLAAVEERRERESRMEEARREEDEREMEEMREREEEERKEQEERDKKEKEEYEAWKDMFKLEEEGEDGGMEEEDEEMLEKFCGRLREGRIVVLEEVGMEFGMGTEEVVDRVVKLEEMGRINGVFDDRGKYVCVSEEEMKQMALFIEKRGRISIEELAIETSRLLELDSVT